MPETIIALFDKTDDAAAAVGELRREGLPRSAVTIVSSEPVHIESDEDSKSRIGAFTIIGGMLGWVAGLAMTVWTSERVGLVTGGMPIRSFWAFGIIIFELTALGAILATLARLLFEARLARRSSAAAYAEEVADGRVALIVDCANESECGIAEKILAASKR
jgi:ActD protein